MHTPSVVVINLLSYTLCHYLEKFSYFANSGLDGCDNFFSSKNDFLSSEGSSIYKIIATIL